MKQAIIYIHGKGGCAGDAARFAPLFPAWEIIGCDYRSAAPWEAKEEFTRYFSALSRRYDRLWVIAESIGAYFLMNAALPPQVERACFISPIVHMERLIVDMMGWAGVTEDELHQKQRIETAFGETLSWDYLCYVRDHPLVWTIPTRILYGEADDLTSMETITDFATTVGATLCVMPGGAHWFHTPAQLSFLTEQLKEFGGNDR